MSAAPDPSRLEVSDQRFEPAIYNVTPHKRPGGSRVTLDRGAGEWHTVRGEHTVQADQAHRKRSEPQRARSPSTSTVINKIRRKLHANSRVSFRVPICSILNLFCRAFVRNLMSPRETETNRHKNANY